MQARHSTGSDDVLQNAIGLKEDVLAVVYLYRFAYQRINEGQGCELAVKETRQRLYYLRESRLSDKHRVEHAVLRIGLGVLTYTAAGERSVAYVHRKEPVVHRRLPVHRQGHMLRLMLGYSRYQAEEVVDRVAAQIVLERLRLLAAERVHTKAYGVDEIAVVLNAVAPVCAST